MEPKQIPIIVMYPSIMLLDENNQDFYPTALPGVLVSYDQKSYTANVRLFFDKVPNPELNIMTKMQQQVVCSYLEAQVSLHQVYLLHTLKTKKFTKLLGERIKEKMPVENEIDYIK